MKQIYTAVKITCNACNHGDKFAFASSFLACSLVDDNYSSDFPCRNSYAVWFWEWHWRSVRRYLSIRTELLGSYHSVKLKNRKRRIFNEANFDHERDRWQAHHLQGHGERINCGDECLLFCSFYFLSMIAKHSEQRLMRKSFRPSAPFT